MSSIPEYYTSASNYILEYVFTYGNPSAALARIKLLSNFSNTTSEKTYTGFNVSGTNAHWWNLAHDKDLNSNVYYAFEEKYGAGPSRNLYKFELAPGGTSVATTTFYTYNNGDATSGPIGVAYVPICAGLTYGGIITADYNLTQLTVHEFNSTKTSIAFSYKVSITASGCYGIDVIPSIVSGFANTYVVFHSNSSRFGCMRVNFATRTWTNETYVGIGSDPSDTLVYYPIGKSVISGDSITSTNRLLSHGQAQAYNVYSLTEVSNTLSYTQLQTVTAPSSPFNYTYSLTPGAYSALQNLAIVTTAVPLTTSTTATSGGNVTSDGGFAVTAKGVVWNTSASPTIILSTKTNDGTGTGSYISNLTGLSSNTLYYVRAYATNTNGTSYGSELTFTTANTTPSLAATTAATSITLSSAISGGNVLSNNGFTITARGIVWSTSTSPTIALPTKTTESGTTGSFLSIMTGLADQTIYYVRAYATNTNGTSYGSEILFTTIRARFPDTDASAYFYYKFNSDTSDSTIILDSSPNARHGTKLGGTILIQNSRKAYNGAGEGVNTIRYVGTQSGITAVTWAAWIYVNSTPGTTGLIVSRGNGGATCGMYLNGLNLRHIWNNTYASQTSLVNVSLQTWTHVGIVVTPSVSYWYLNGSLVETKTQAYSTVTIGNGFVGTDPVAASNNFPGYIDHTLYSLREYAGSEILKAYEQIDSQQFFYKGFITNFRWTKGQSWYNSNFSVPTNNLSGTVSTTVKLAMQASSIQTVTRDASLFSTSVVSQDITWSSNSPFVVAGGGGGPSISNLSAQLNTIATYLRNYMSEFRNPNFYFYSLDGSGQSIGDGGGDMYDGGNATNPWLRSGTQYTGNSPSIITETANYQTASTTTVVDTDWNYISLGYANPGFLPLTVLGTRSVVGQPVGWQVSGNSGADGGGQLISGLIYNGISINGYTVYAFYRCMYGAGDPSTCDLYILIGSPNWGSVFGTISSYADPNRDGNGGFFYTSGADVRNILAIKTLLSKSSGVLVTDVECQTVIQAFITRINLALGSSGGGSSGGSSGAPTVATGISSFILSPSTALYFGNVISDGGVSTTARGLVWNTEPSAVVAFASKTTLAGGIGVYSSILTNLSESVPYYIRAYATNSNASAYGAESILYIPARPTLQTTVISALTSTSVITGGTVLTTGDRINSEGVLWNTNPGADISTVSTRTILYGSFSTNTFTSHISTLFPGTVYYLRAYATHFTTGYGNELTFSTLNGVPTILTVSSGETISSGSTIMTGNLVTTGGTDVTIRGFCWDLNSSPTTTLSTKTEELGLFSTGIYSSIITGLLESSSYYLRAYATSMLGTGYGSNLFLSSALYTFTTFTFTNATITGISGPTLVQIRAAYSATSWTQTTAFLNMSVQGIQIWTVPRTGTYRIETLGAKGGDGTRAVGGNGARMIGNFNLTQGQKLRVLVGQMGTANTILNGGGGGGTFVMRETGSLTSDILVIAGGGGAGGFLEGSTVSGATTADPSQAGWNGNNRVTLANGRSGANGGLCQDGSGGGGGGLIGNGGSSLQSTATTAGKGGNSFINGAIGATSDQSGPMNGGFGGGGSGDWNYWTGGGGGGGYSGGSGGYYYGMGGGGSSYNNGTSQNNTAAFNSTHGSVTITLL